MAIGNPINLTSNVESKNISVIATAGQTQFTVTGGYRINQISVFRNGVRLVDGRDFTALDGSIVTLLSAALVGDALEFQIFDDFRVADALSVNSGGTVNGNVTVTGILSTTNLSIGSSISLDATTGIITAVQVIGGTITGTATTAINAQGLIGTPDITVNNIVAAAGTFSGVLTYEDVTNIDSLGIVTARTGVDITANGLVVNAGVSTFAADLSIADKIIHTGDSNTAIRFPSPDTFTVETTGIQRFEVNSTGDVGLVGIATATGLVVVAGSGIYAGHTGVITATSFDGSFTGNITGAASQVTVADESSDTTCFPLFTTAATGNLPPKSGTNLTFNSSTGALTATSFVGALTGNVTGNSAGTHTGAVDLNGGVLTLDADADTTITADTDDQIDIAFGGNDRITLSPGLIDLKNSGAQSALRLYCEVSNAHYAALQAPAHSAFSGNITLTLPATTDTLVGRTTTDTLTNKTLTSPTITGTGNIAGTFTGNVTGNADTATTATTSTNVTVADESSDTTCFPLFATAATGNLPPKSGTNLTFNSSSGALTATSFSGNISGGTIAGTTGTFTGLLTVDGNAVRSDRTGSTQACFSARLNGVEKAGIQAGGAAQFAGDVSIADKIVHTGDTNTAIRFPADDTFTVETGGSERIRVDSSGRTLINTPASIQSDDTTQGYTPALQVVHRASNAGTNGISLSRFQAGNANGTPFIFQKSKNDTIGSHTIVADDDQIGLVEFAGSDGADFRTAASISGFVDGTPGTNDMPGRLIFSTSADGSATPTEKLRIDSNGNFIFKNGALVENGEVTSTAATGTQNFDLTNGMVLYRTSNSTGTWKPNFRINGSVSINSVMSDGDVVSPTLVVAKGATSHYATTIQIDGSDVTPEFLGGAPSEGGGSGTFDIYSYTIIKTGNAAFKVFASVSNYE